MAAEMEMGSVAESNPDNNNTDESKPPCDLAEGYSFILQFVVGVLAFSTLICKLVL